MKTYHFIKAEPLLAFIEKYREKIVGQTLKHFDSDLWLLANNQHHSSDEPVILELDDYYIAIYYFLTSDLKICIGKKEEIEKDRKVAYTMGWRSYVFDYYGEEFGVGEKKELIEGCKVIDITVERFSTAFECDAVTGKMRPDGGDYFSTIRIYLDSGKKICLCGESALCDGYVSIWCE